MPPTRTRLRCRWRYALGALCYICIMVDTMRKPHVDRILENFDD